MPTVLLLRHGRTTSNADGALAGRGEVALDEIGQAQARTIGERLHGVALAAVVSSPLLRCRQTLELALPAAEVALEPGLVECGYGDWEGRPLKRLAKDPLWPVVQQHPSAATFPGESGEAMAARAVAAVRRWDARIVAEHGPGALWLACGHGDVIKAVVADALGLHLDLFQRIVVDPGSLTIIRYTPLRPFLLRLNDTGPALGGLVARRRPRARTPRKSAAMGADRAMRSDADVGGGAGPADGP